MGLAGGREGLRAGRALGPKTSPVTHQGTGEWGREGLASRPYGCVPTHDSCQQA